MLAVHAAHRYATDTKAGQHHHQYPGRRHQVVVHLHDLARLVPVVGNELVPPVHELGAYLQPSAGEPLLHLQDAGLGGVATCPECRMGRPHAQAIAAVQRRRSFRAVVRSRAMPVVRPEARSRRTDTLHRIRVLNGHHVLQLQCVSDIDHVRDRVVHAEDRPEGVAELPARSTHAAEIEAPSQSPVAKRLNDRRYLKAFARNGEDGPRPHDGSSRLARVSFVEGEAIDLPFVLLALQVAVRLVQDILTGHIDEALVRVVASLERLVQFRLAAQRGEGDDHRPTRGQEAGLALGIDLEIVRLLI